MTAPAAVGYIKMIELHDYVQFFLVVILFFVLWFYITIILDFGDFNSKQAPAYLLNKTYVHTIARSIAHLGWLEVIWTIIPILILTAIAIPSFKLLYALDVVNSPLLTLRCIGNQWYWTYECDIEKPTFKENYEKFLNDKYFLQLEFLEKKPKGSKLLKSYQVKPYQVTSSVESAMNILRQEYPNSILVKKWSHTKSPAKLQEFMFGLTEAKAKLSQGGKKTYNPQARLDSLKSLPGRLIKFSQDITRIQSPLDNSPKQSDAQVNNMTDKRGHLLGNLFEVKNKLKNTEHNTLRTILDDALSNGSTNKRAKQAIGKLRVKIKGLSVDAKNRAKNTAMSEYQTAIASIIVTDSELFKGSTIPSKVISHFMYLTNRYTQKAASFSIDSYMLDVDELQLGAFRLLEVDNYPILPADAEIRLAVTGTDVIHSYAVPSLGVKIDAIPGRLNQVGIRVRSPGTYYGQCSELCGVGHGFMPIKIQFIKLIK